MILVTAAEMRSLDELAIRKYRVPGFRLMQRAGRGAAKVLLQRLRPGRRERVAVCVGRGNNGGDGLIVARELKAKGVAVDVFSLAEPDAFRGDAARALAAFQRVRGKIEFVTAASLPAFRARLRNAAVVVDAIFGTGLRGPVEGLAAQVIESINEAGVPVLAVDIPSGLDADRGVPLGCAVRATATATFGFAKVGMAVYPGVEYAGELHVVDIGIPPEAVREIAPRTHLIESGDAAQLVPRRRPTAHKGDAGHVLVIAGGRGKTGAGVLAARAATRTGAGLVTLAGPASQQPILAAGVLEAMTALLPDRDGQIGFDSHALAKLTEGKRAVVFGPGIGTHEDAVRTLEWLINHLSVPLVIDADGLTCAVPLLRRLREARPPLVLTPHPGEMARLTGAGTTAVQVDRVGAARDFAAQHRCTLVLKGARTVVAASDGSVAINPTGNPGMASGGMGDVLAGMVGALLAQGLQPFDAARLAVFAHGLAADRVARERGQIGLLASDVIERVPPTLHALEAGHGA